MGFRDTLKKWDAEKAKVGSDLPPADDLVPVRQEQSEAPAVPKPTTDQRTTVATSPEHAVQLQAAASKQREADAAALPALAFGAARGASLGAVDRLAGLGTLIGEHLGATEQNPARPGAYQEGRAEYLVPEDKARKLSPGMHLLGELAGGAPVAVAAPQSLAGRLAFSGGLGAASGALNTREDDAKKMATNAAKGAALSGAAEGTIGTVARKLIRNAPEREMKATVAGIMESEAGRNAAGTGRQLARNGENVKQVLKDNPEARIAMRGDAESAIPVVEGKLSEAYAGQPQRYAVIDQTLKPMTVTQLLSKLVQAEKNKNVPLEQLEMVKDGLKHLRDSMRSTVAPRWGGTETWDGKRLELTTEQLREWVTSIQGAAAPAYRGLHPADTTKARATLAQLANDILEERLDAAAKKGGKDVADVVAQIRDTDKKVSAWLTVQGALKERGLRETAQAMGLQQRIGKAAGEAEMAAAGGLALEGHIAPAVALAGKGLIARTADKITKAVDYGVLSPWQTIAERRAALNGLKAMAMDPRATLADMFRMGAENGIPQSLIRALYERQQKRGKIAIPLPESATESPIAQPMRSAQDSASPSYPREYATSTRTQ